MDNNRGLTGKTALITGASSGIGREFATLFARDGCDLVLVARDAARLGQLADELRRETSGAVTVVPQDLAQGDAAEALVAGLRRRGVAVDILINNAGFNVAGPSWETAAEEERPPRRADGRDGPRHD
jgi:hypothetical protein